MAEKFNITDFLLQKQNVLIFVFQSMVILEILNAAMPF
jgi:hypothetical protein